MDIVISDLDGTLLDHATYSFEDALPGLKLLKDRQIPLLYCSSKTRKEIEHWRRLTGNDHPFIVENGGAVVVPTGYFGFAIPEGRAIEGYVVVQLGDSYPDLVRCLEGAAATSGCRVIGFHDMTEAEVAQFCGLPPESAALAKAREFDEPFLILDDGNPADLLAAIERQGKRWTRGGRFYHILGNSDKAAGTRLLLDLYLRAGSAVRSIGIGDGVNDAPFLNAVHLPILIRTPWLEELQSAVPAGSATNQPGPRGWNEAILSLFA